MTEAEVAQAYRDYAPAVYARAHRILREREAARDVMQEVFVRCFGYRPSVASERELLAWLYRVTTNLCLSGDVAISPDGQYVAVIYDGDVTVYRVSDGSQVKFLPYRNQIL
ncbi:MAG TPA: sigma factor [Polyangia bacterium]